MWNRVERLLGAEAFARLKRAHVGIIGLGSGGGFVAEALAMSGVGSFVLIDPKYLSDVNVPRHIGGLWQVGIPKVEVVDVAIQNRNPQARVALRMGTFADNVGALTGCDLLVVCVDSEAVKFQVNEWALAHNVPAIYAGVYERGIGGDVCVITPHQGPCYACWAEQLRDTSSPSDTPQEALDYGQVEAGVLNAEPGLWLDVVRVASMQAKLALNFLLYGQGAPNTVVTANEVMEIIDGAGKVRPFTTEWFRVEPLEGCLVCGDLTVAPGEINDVIE